MKTKKTSAAPEIDPRFALVVNAFAKDRQVSHGGGKGFGSGALKVNGKIFAMMSSKGQCVVKLPKERVNELVASGMGENYDPGRGRLMKEWVVVPDGPVSWIGLAKEAYRFVKAGPIVAGKRISRK